MAYVSKSYLYEKFGSASRDMEVLLRCGKDDRIPEEDVLRFSYRIIDNLNSTINELRKAEW